MKNSICIFSGLLLLGVCIIVSSVILSNSFNESVTQHHSINGNLNVSQSTNSETKSEYMPIGEISRLLGYDDIDVFSQDVLNNKLGDLPYVNVNGELIFSWTAFNEWLVDSANKQRSKDGMIDK